MFLVDGSSHAIFKRAPGATQAVFGLAVKVRQLSIQIHRCKVPPRCCEMFCENVLDDFKVLQRL